MLKTAFLLGLTVVFVYLGLEIASIIFDIPRSEIFSWTGIIFLAFVLERALRYLLMMPFKIYFEDVRKHHLAKNVQETGFSLSYISIWLAVGYSPINGIVQGNNTKLTISYPIFLKIALVLITATIIFSILWLLTLKFKKK
jgi:hypothetical protein